MVITKRNYLQNTANMRKISYICVEICTKQKKISMHFNKNAPKGVDFFKYPEYNISVTDVTLLR